MLRRHFRAWACLAGLAAMSCGLDAKQDTPEPPPSSDPIEPIAYDALFVVNGGDDSISVIDTTRLEVTGTIRLTNAHYPHHIYLNGDHSKLVVAAPGSDLSAGHSGHDDHGGGTPGAVLVLDARTGATITSRRLRSMNHNALYSPDETEIWTTQLDGFALVLDPSTLEERRSIPVGLAPSEVTFSVDGRNAFVANTNSASISVIDSHSKELVATLPVGVNPVGAWQGSNGIAYVDNEFDGTLSAIDTRLLRVVNTYRLGFVPGMVGYGPDKYVWVADSNNSQVTINEAGADVRVAVAPAGRGAHGIAFNGDGKTAYVSNQGANTISVIDVATRQTIKTIAVGSKPNGMAWRGK